MRFTMHTLCIYIKIYIKFSEKVQFFATVFVERQQKSCICTQAVKIAKFAEASRRCLIELKCWKYWSAGNIGVLERATGFEPAHDGLGSRCLTTWLYPLYTYDFLTIAKWLFIANKTAQAFTKSAGCEWWRVPRRAGVPPQLGMASPSTGNPTCILHQP